jgi:hypothetical protein
MGRGGVSNSHSAAANPLALARVKDCQPNYFSVFVAHDDIIVGEVAVRCVAWLLEIDVERIRLGVVRGPKELARRPFKDRQ